MTLGADYFAGVYEATDDPWGLATRWYEQRKYAITLAALPKERYHRALEAGCSIGVLTRQLAARCDHLLAVDLAAEAVRRAAERTAALPNVQVQQGALPHDWPTGQFDLVVLSEVGYYFDEPDWRRLVTVAARALEPGATLIAVHWRHPVADYPRSGDAVHASLEAVAEEVGLVRTVRHEELDFLLDVYLRTPPDAQSVAQQTDLAE